MPSAPRAYTGSASRRLGGTRRTAAGIVSSSTAPGDLIIHGPAHRGANGAAMPTDEGDQDGGHFFFNHPERWGYPAA